MFPHGDGSLVRIDLRYNVSESSTIYPQYIAYITYDQGSSKNFVGKPLSLVDVLFNFWGTYWIPIVTIAVGIYILLSMLLFQRLSPFRRAMWIKSPITYLVLPFIRLAGDPLFGIFWGEGKFRRYNNAKQILDDVIYIQKSYRNYPEANYSDAWNRTKVETRRQSLNYDMKVYDLIESLFYLLGDWYRICKTIQNAKQDEKQDEETLHNLDLKIEEKCNEIIYNIDWKAIINPKQ